MNLFQTGDFVLHSGRRSNFKIDCDALTSEDWEALASLISKQFRFRGVCGVPEGGIELALALEKYANYEDMDLPYLIVDDVLTTGASMEQMKEKLENDGGWTIKGVVVFAREKCPEWVDALFKMY